MRLSLCLLLSALAACGGGGAGGESSGDRGPSSGDAAAAAEAEAMAHVPRAVAMLAVQQAGCAACHSLGEEPLAAVLQPSAARSLNEIASTAGAVERFALESHFGGAHAADLRAWLSTLAPAGGAQGAAAEPTEIAAGMIEGGQRLADELACGACHVPAELNLSASADHRRLAAFLREPRTRYPQLAHVPLQAGEADQVAAWLLRDQKQEGATANGFAYSCYELKIRSGDWPDVSAREPAASGVTRTLDTSSATRKQNYALEFTATLDVPATGEWQFATRSDDGSWLWIDGELVVDNAGLKPARRRQGSIQLRKGAHQLRVAYTQGGGGQELGVLWSGPGVAEQPISAERASVTVVQLVPPAAAGTPVAPVAEEAVARGRLAARSQRCDACHAVDDEAFDALPAPEGEVRAWRDLDQPRGDVGAGGCLMPAGPGFYQEVGALPELSGSAVDPAIELRIALGRDGCLSCHQRNGEGGLPAAVRKQLTEREDIGEEGMVPPDLSSVGRRLRPEWIERVVRDGHKARPYVAVRMPRYGPEKAGRYAELFAKCDADGLVDEEPAFDEEAIELGRKLAGAGGRNCISCHRMAGHASLGPQGMDLSMQHERVRPGWFRDWLLEPQSLRPNTRMPALWLGNGEQDRKEVDAIRSWMSLGDSAPLPSGIVVDRNSLVLEPIGRPVLHGAFLKGVSARCLAVGTPERTHYAFDLATPRLVWIWRGGFLDARGTWHGRAGKLVEPHGKDWIVVKDFELVGSGKRRLLGQKRTDAGYPVLRVGFGDASFLDSLRPRFVAGGSELERTITCESGELALEFAETDGLRTKISGGTANETRANVYHLSAGQELKVVYQW